MKVEAVGLDGRENVLAFCLPPDMLASVQAIAPSGLQRVFAALPDKPKSMVALGSGVTNSRATALSTCELEQVNFRAVESAMSRHPEWGVGVFSAMTMHALVKERRERDLLMLTPEQRYRRFLDDYPDLVDSVAQKDIASYLGITPVGLSRIVGRLRKTQPAVGPTGSPGEA